MCLIGSVSDDMLRAIDSPLDERPSGTVSIFFYMMCCMLLPRFIVVYFLVYSVDLVVEAARS